MTKFQVGKTYYGRSICDSNSIALFTIKKRTDKTVTIEAQGKIVRRGIRVYNDIESFQPFGNYSMAMSVYADKVA